MSTPHQATAESSSGSNTQDVDVAAVLKTLQNLSIEDTEEQVLRAKIAAQGATVKEALEILFLYLAKVKEQGVKITEQGAKIEEQDSKTGYQAAVIAEQDEKLAYQDAVIAEEKDASVKDALKTLSVIAFKDAAIVERDEKLAYQDAVIAEQGAKLAEQATNLNAQAATIASLNAQLAQQDTQTASQAAVVGGGERCPADKQSPTLPHVIDITDFDISKLKMLHQILKIDPNYVIAGCSVAETIEIVEGKIFEEEPDWTDEE
jgi:hypothetical protein